MKIFLWSKFLYNCIPLTFLVVLLVFLTNHALHATGLLMCLSTATSLMLCISVSGLGTGFGAIYPHFQYENVASVSMSIGGIAFMLTSFGVVIATISLESAAYYLYRIRPGISGAASIGDKAIIAACLAAITLINAASFYLPMRRGQKRLMEKNETM